jgi:hypothetical protein
MSITGSRVVAGTLSGFLLEGGGGGATPRTVCATRGGLGAFPAKGRGVKGRFPPEDFESGAATVPIRKLK